MAPTAAQPASAPEAAAHGMQAPQNSSLTDAPASKGSSSHAGAIAGMQALLKHAAADGRSCFAAAALHTASLVVKQLLSSWPLEARTPVGLVSRTLSCISIIHADLSALLQMSSRSFANCLKQLGMVSSCRWGGGGSGRSSCLDKLACLAAVVQKEPVRRQETASA